MDIKPKQPMEQHKAFFTVEESEVGNLYYFSPLVRAPGPYRQQRHVEAIIDIDAEGNLAGVELIDTMPPPPSAAGDEMMEMVRPRPRRPENRKSFTYRMYCDLVAAAKNGLRRKLAIRAVSVQYGINRKIVERVWNRFIRPNMIEVQGRARDLF